MSVSSQRIYLFNSPKRVPGTQVTRTLAVSSTQRLVHAHRPLTPIKLSLAVIIQRRQDAIYDKQLLSWCGWIYGVKAEIVIKEESVGQVGKI